MCTGYFPLVTHFEVFGLPKYKWRLCAYSSSVLYSSIRKFPVVSVGCGVPCGAFSTACVDPPPQPWMSCMNEVITSPCTWGNLPNSSELGLCGRGSRAISWWLHRKSSCSYFSCSWESSCFSLKGLFRSFRNPWKSPAWGRIGNKTSTGLKELAEDSEAGEPCRNTYFLLPSQLPGNWDAAPAVDTQPRTSAEKHCGPKIKQVFYSFFTFFLLENRVLLILQETHRDDSVQ